jgi:hypothetical protein
MKVKVITLSVSLALLAAWAGKFFPSSWPDGHY